MEGERCRNQEVNVVVVLFRHLRVVEVYEPNVRVGKEELQRCRLNFERGSGLAKIEVDLPKPGRPANHSAALEPTPHATMTRTWKRCRLLLLLLPLVHR